MRQFVFAIALVALAGLTPIRAEQQAPPAWEQTTFNTWKSLHDKILVMARDTMFPDEKLGWKPHPDSRSVLDEFRHVTIGLEMSTAQLTGAKFDYNARMKADEAKPKTRASVVAEMEAAMAASYAAVQKDAKPSLIQ